MAEIIIIYTPELQRLITESNDANAQFYLAKYLLESKQKDERKKAFSLFKKLANQSYTTVQTDARYILGVCYENGYGITKSYPRAIRWYKMVHHNIGNDLFNDKAFEDRINKEIDKLLDELDNREIAPEVVDYLIDAAESGDVEAQKYLMELYQYGDRTIKPNEEEAAYWAERAVENGDEEAMDQLGHMYYYGQGVERNFRKGLDLMEMAAERGYANSAYFIGRHYEKMTANRTAVKWFRLCAELEIKQRNKRLGRNPTEQMKLNEGQK